MGDESVTDDPDDAPPWWDENVDIREELDLPGYDAPKFQDGTYVHTVVERLESRLDCQIQFIDPSPKKASRWEIRVDGDPVETVHRTRDVDANTVFGITEAEFERVVESNVTTDD
ncbi:hypothetical protein [Haloarcula salina]|uniref:Uncharacterized protein n=1 Tax=Haloarcula salina TaxID=1429914 RepID=A0AA41G395_9EURY|nr:hypothetical protein [Haloarcula salina]MBV0903530.1 hypothetical protein [Haloarcula salina]